MQVYVGGLWPNVRREDLDRLVRESLRGPWYRMRSPRGRLIDCQLLELVDRDKGRSEYCAVIEVDPSRLGWVVVKYLQGIRVNQRVLRAHRWFARRTPADRRMSAVNGRLAKGESVHERRMGGDRRRPLDVRPLDRPFLSTTSAIHTSNVS